jgi:dTDP-4-dehydrorhamnose reductase
MKKTLLFTGGSGLMALSGAQALRNNFFVVLGTHIRHINNLSGVDSKFIDMDSVDKILRFLEEIESDVVIHTAGLTSIERCESEEKLAHHINVILSENIAKACKIIGVNFIHISTDHVFSGSESMAIEEDFTDPINVYGKTKVEAEIRVLESNPDTLVIRTNFFCWSPSYRQSFSSFIIDSLRKNKRIFLFQDAFFTPILVEQVMHVIQDLINHKAFGIYHVVGDERLSKYDFGLKIAKEFSLDAELITSSFLSKQAHLVKRPLDMSLSNKKTSKLLGKELGCVNLNIGRLKHQEQMGYSLELKSL